MVLHVFPNVEDGSMIYCIHFKSSLLRKWLLITFHLENPLSNSYTKWNDCNFFVPNLHKFRPICVPFQVVATYASSLKYYFVLTLMSECFRKFLEFSLTRVTFFFGILKLQQYPLEPQFGICDLVIIIAWIIMRAEKFGCIEYWKVWETIIQSMNFFHIRCTQCYASLKFIGFINCRYMNNMISCIVFITQPKIFCRSL